MNILFLMKLMHIGGQEMVTITLANYFSAQGHHVSIACFEKPWMEAVERTNRNVHFFTLGKFEYSSENVQKLKEILCEEKIDVVVNQWGLPYVPTKVLNAAIKLCENINPNIKTIAVYHNDPCENARIKDVEIALSNCRNTIKRLTLNAKKLLFKMITSRSMRYVYEHCNQYQVLSPSYIEHFKMFTGIKDVNHLVFQANPVTIDTGDYPYTVGKKQKEIIYCGRIDFNQKRVFRVVDVWSKLEDVFPDWRLTIVGDGESRADIEQLAKERKLKRISFEGFQKPLEYYKRASILVLTSEYEGFPLVLAECMSFGVVPCVYDSFSAVHDIIQDGYNGCIINRDANGTFSPKMMADKLSSLMSNEDLRNQMALNAIETSKKYSIDTIYAQWMKLLGEIVI